MKGRPRLTAAVALVVGLALLWVCLSLVARARLEARPAAAFFGTHRTPGDPAGSELLVFAHQGGELLWPSNTMVAFEAAVALGADVLDTDLVRTADGELVLLHDTTVDRTSNGSGEVADLALAELRTLDFGYRFQPRPGVGGEPYPYRGRGHGIVTVEELFARFVDQAPSVGFGIEIKQVEPQAADELCAAIGRFDLHDRVLVSSFTQPNMDRFRSVCPTVATSATEPEFRRFFIAQRLGLNGLVRPNYQALQIPPTAAGVTVLSAEVVAAARSWGLAVVPWTIDDPDDLAAITALGVDGINTNRPDLLLDQLGR